MSAFDVWVIRFQSGGEVSPAEGLQRIFGIDAAAAAEVEQTVPRVVKHRVQAEAAAEMRRALESIGAVVECRPARPSRRVKEAGSGPPEGISVPATAAVERIKMEAPVMGQATTMASVAPAKLPAVSGSRPKQARPVPARPVPPMTQPLSVPAPESAGSESAVVTESSPGEAEPPSPGLYDYLDNLFGNRRRRCFAQAFAMLALALLIFVFGLAMGNSVFRGEAGALGITLAGGAFYLIGAAGYELYTLVRG